MNPEKVLAWHFGNDKLGYDDGRRVRDGVRQKYRIEPGWTRLKMCCDGMHASIHLLDALFYWGNHEFLWRVELSGRILTGCDKVCAEYRRPLWHVNAEPVVRRFCELSREEMEAACNRLGRELNWAAPLCVAGTRGTIALFDYLKHETHRIASCGDKPEIILENKQLLTKLRKRINGIVAREHRRKGVKK